MPRIDKTMLKTAGGGFLVSSRRAAAEEKMEMTVFKADSSIFAEFVGDIYDAIESQYRTVGGHGQELPFTKVDLVKYAFTAMCTRVRMINRDRTPINGERFDIRCNDPWRIPAVLAGIINAVGMVVNEQPVITIVPVWNHELDDQILTVPQWHRVSQAILAVSRTEGMKMVLVESLASDRSGDEMLMTLIPVRDEMGRIRQIAHRTIPVDPSAAAVYIISGFDHEIYAGMSLASPALLLPPYFVTVGEVQQNLWRLTDVA